jgi:hypothetical protein
MRSLKNSRRFYLIGFIAALAVAFVARQLYYYPGPLRVGGNPLGIASFYQGPNPSDFESTPPSVNPLSGFSDVPAVEGGEGRIVVIDLAHDNAFTTDELTSFSGGLASNGAQIVFARGSDDLIGALPQASALIVIAPNDDFDVEEVRAVDQFVAKGGRLVVVGEPTRQTSVDALNSLAGGFGVIYQDAYIYNLGDNDAGFRNVVFHEFAEDSAITEGVSEVVFQTAYALRTDEASGVIFGDDQTYSSQEETPGNVIAAALTADGHVLTLPDFTFFTSPFNTFSDNEVLIGNISAFALSGARGFDLTDFPHFFQSPTDLVYQNPVTLNQTFEDSVALRTSLASVGTEASLADAVGEDNPYIYVSLYDDASNDVLDLLEANGITISDEPLSDDSSGGDGTIAIEGVARLEMGDTTFMHLAQPGGEDDDDRYRLVILASDEETLSAGVARLLAGDLNACLVTATTAVCQGASGSGDGGSGGSDGGDSGGDDGGDDGGFEGGGGEGAILVVNDNQAIPVYVADTGAQTSANILEGLGYTADVYDVLADGTPELDLLQSYGAVMWLTGDYCCVAPNTEGADVLQAYVEGGGHLFISGMFIATDWQGTDFLADVLHAEFADYGVLFDLEAGDAHPISEGLESVTLGSQDLELTPDLIAVSGEASVVFVRGPESVGPGEPAMLAYEDGDTRVSYAVFPLFALDETDLGLLVSNLASWLIGVTEPAP